MNSKKKNNGSSIKKTAGAVKAKPRYKGFLYLLPENTPACELMRKLEFLSPDALEIWPELDILEITTENGTITFEDMMEGMYPEDEKLLRELKLKKIYACDYSEADRELTGKIMSIYLESFGGIMGSDTDDFKPYMSLEEL